MNTGWLVAIPTVALMLAGIAQHLLHARVSGGSEGRFASHWATATGVLMLTAVVLELSPLDPSERVGIAVVMVALAAAETMLVRLDSPSGLRGGWSAAGRSVSAAAMAVMAMADPTRVGSSRSAHGMQMAGQSVQGTAFYAGVASLTLLSAGMVCALVQWILDADSPVPAETHWYPGQLVMGQCAMCFGMALPALAMV